MRHNRPQTRAGPQSRRGVMKPTPPELMIDTGTGLDFETRLDRLPGYLAPVDRFLIRNHAPPRYWTPTVGGCTSTATAWKNRSPTPTPSFGASLWYRWYAP